jgi:hypothetical protein
MVLAFAIFIAITQSISQSALVRNFLIRLRSRLSAFFRDSPRSSAGLLELNLAFDLKRQTNFAERHCRFGRDPLVALEFVLRQGLPHRFLDLALGSNTEPLEEFANASIENSSFIIASTLRLLT